MSITTPVLSYLQNPEKTLPMLLIEVPTTGGRTIQGYRHGGKQEGRERICEETLGAVVWLFGIKTFNKIGDFVGEKILGLKDLNCDVGKDSLRNPFAYVKDKKALTAGFKFGKIALSTVLGVLAMGMAVPKIKKAMTNAFRAQQGLEPIPDKNGEYKKSWADKLVGFFIRPKKDNKFNQKSDNLQFASFNSNIPNMSEFLNSTKSQDNKQVAFKGSLVDGLLFSAHNLENNTAWRLLSTDTGTLAGRVINSRNKKEAIEYAVRDSISSFFYVFAAPLFSGFLRKTVNVPNIHPKGAEVVAEHLKEVVDKHGGKIDDFDFFSSKFGLDSEAAKTFDNIKFMKNDTIWLKDFNKQTQARYFGKATFMSKLQPMLQDSDGEFKAILSKKQVEDILSYSETSDPVFLKKAISEATNGKSDNVKSFVSRNNLEKIRDSFDKFTVGLEKYASKKNLAIDADLIDKYTKNLNRKNLGIHFAGILFAILGLAYFIPKLQYLVSDKLTGTKGYNLNSTEDNKNNKTNA